LGKWCTLASGAVTLGVATALVYAGKQTETTVLEVDKVAGSLWGVLLVVFLTGILTRWATARAAFVALLAGLALNATLPWFFYYGTPPAERISFAWVGIPGMCVAALIVLAGSWLDARKPSNLAGLTWRTLSGEDARR
jgi:Na+/proline symporter